MPSDVASTLYNVVGDADGDLEFTMKGLKELLSGRSGYAAAATARAAAKLLLGAEEVNRPTAFGSLQWCLEYNMGNPQPKDDADRTAQLDT